MRIVNIARLLHRTQAVLSCLLGLVLSARAQQIQPAAESVFEVASVKISSVTNGESQGGPGTEDPGMYRAFPPAGQNFKRSLMRNARSGILSPLGSILNRFNWGESWVQRA